MKRPDLSSWIDRCAGVDEIELLSMHLEFLPDQGLLPPNGGRATDPQNQG